jgi:hypothetical protein
MASVMVHIFQLLHFLVLLTLMNTKKLSSVASVGQTDLIIRGVITE